MFHRHPCLSPQIQTVQTIKVIMVVSPLVPRCWHLPSPGGLADFPSYFPPPPASTVSPDLPTETRGQRRRRRTLCMIQMLIYFLARRCRRGLRLLPPLEQQRPQAGSPSGITPTCPWCRCLIRAQRPRLRRQLRPSHSGRTPFHPPPPSTPASFRLGIGHGLPIQH